MTKRFLHGAGVKRRRVHTPARRRCAEAVHGTWRPAGSGITSVLVKVARPTESHAHVPFSTPNFWCTGSPSARRPRGMSPIAHGMGSMTAGTPRGQRGSQDGPAIARGAICDTPDAYWPAFRDACVAWLTRRYGVQLCCVTSHTGATHPHLHVVLNSRVGSAPKTARGEGRSRHPRCARRH